MPNPETRQNERPKKPRIHVHGEGCICHSHSDPEDVMLGFEDDPLNAERALRDARYLLRGGNLPTDEEYARITAGLNDESVRRIREERLRDPLEQAHDLALSAYEADGPAEALDLAARALALDPDCLDALSVQVQHDPSPGGEALARLEDTVERVWKDIEARAAEPFMEVLAQPALRARMLVGDILRLDGHPMQAAVHYMQVLKYAPDDYQAAAVLLGCALAVPDLDLAQRVLDGYAGPGMAVFGWGRALASFLAGDRRRANASLKSARQMNPYVEQFLLRTRELGELELDEFEAGSEDEARTVVFALGPAWLSSVAAVEWLRGRVARK